MHSGRMTTAARSASRIALAIAAAALLCFTSSVSAGIQLLTSTLLVMGGNTNPGGVTPKMQQELGGDPYYPDPNTNIFKPVGTFGEGYIDTVNNAASPYYGWDFQLVEWPAEISLPLPGRWTYEPSQQQGVHNIDGAISAVLPTLGALDTAVAFGYSSSANVMVREMRQLINQPGGPTATDQLEFFLMGNPNRPNGGILQRFAGLYIPLFDIRLDGSTPVDTPYQVTDIGWEYDTASDFPNYPINLLAVINSLVAGPILHGNYFPADFNGPRALPDTTVGNITYITLEPPHLPLLMPLYDLGFPKALLDLVEPTLTVMVDWGYNRAISPGTPQRAQLIPRINPIKAVVDLADSVVEGVHNFIGDLTPAHSSTAVTTAPVTAAAPSKRAARRIPSAAAQSVLSPVKATPRAAAAGAPRHHRPSPSQAPRSAARAASAHSSRKAAA